ncbi:MAG: hypothetical protein KJ017_10220 [Alphaproteobacteria bacterium]|nr:hypothetical protein [Alphaproteobacteria bacterium]
MSDDIRSFEGVNPTAGNTGAKDSPGRNLARELNRAAPQDVRRRATGGLGGSLGSVAQAMNGFQPSSEVGKVSFGSGGYLNFSNAIKELNSDRDYG